MSKKPFVVGITGGTCSGKSTLAGRVTDALKDDYKVELIHMDHYFKKVTPNTVAPITRKVYVEHNHPDSFEMDRFFADFDAAVANTETDVVVVEGLLILYLDHIREQLDLKVFVDLKSDERIVRRIKRFMAGGQTFDEVTDRYLDTVRYRHDEFIEPTRWHADVVLNGVLDSHKGLQVLLNWIRANVDKA